MSSPVFVAPLQSLIVSDTKTFSSIYIVLSHTQKQAQSVSFLTYLPTFFKVARFIYRTNLPTVAQCSEALNYLTLWQ